MGTGISGKVDRCQAAGLGIGHLEASERLGAVEDRNAVAAIAVRRGDHGDGPVEGPRVPAIGEEVDVLAEPVGEAVRLQGIGAGEHEAVAGQGVQAEPDKLLLELLHGSRGAGERRECLLPHLPHAGR